jgi:5-methyltetrahydrofolate--homocysteine methyltransferase
MIDVAKEMQRNDFKVPLMIGGATTSKIHTAVKINEHYNNNTVIHVLDASKAVGVTSKLIGKDKENFQADVGTEYDTIKENYLNRKSEKEYVSIENARKNATVTDWENEDIPTANQLGVQVFEDIDIATIQNYIDWTPFFFTWEMRKKYPAILDDEVFGEQSKQLLDDANTMLDNIIKNNWLKVKAVVGIWEANSVGDDVQLYENGEDLVTFNFLRQQSKKTKNNRCLADFIAPNSSDKKDYIGAFTCTAGLGIEKQLEIFEQENDDYNSIMLKAVADRLAEALTESMHEKVRKEIWGYASNEQFVNEDLIKEEYRGIRPAPGYTACPDHTEKLKIFKLLNAEQIGVSLTENMAMYPNATVSGYYFSHPAAKYFSVGKVQDDQILDYAKRKNMSVEQIEKWLRSNI